MKKLVLTGANGRLASYLREPLSKICDMLVSSDIVDDIGTLYLREHYQKADLGQFEEINALLKGADMVVHFGAICDEAPFDEIMHSNILGAYNIWEAARRNDVRRVVYASSIHAVGMYLSGANIGLDVPHRPDSYYGLSKCFAEDLARLYWEKCGVEAVCLRIFSCAEVKTPRSLGTWLSYDDLVRLVMRAIDTPVVDFSLIYGISDNDRAPVDNTKARHLGYCPVDNAEKYAKKILENAKIADSQDLSARCIGGPFTTGKLGESVMSALNITDEKKK